MGYLDTPRLHVAGRFYTDPSTVNNDPSHYEPGNTRPSPWQEPGGQHDFALVDCTVRSALGPDGPATGDAVVGAKLTTPLPKSIGGTGSGAPTAKIVDLDVYQQGVSTIYGLAPTLELAGGASLAAAMDRAALNNAWFKSVLPKRGWASWDDYAGGSYGGDAYASGSFQSVLRVPGAQWPDGLSPILDALKAASAVDGSGNVVLSIRFVVDSYINNPENPTKHRYGRFTGAIGPWREGEPIQAAGPRWLRAPNFPAETDPWYKPALFHAPFKVDAGRAKLVLDLANAIPKQEVGGPRVDLGTVTAVFRPAGGPAVPVGPVDCSSFAYENDSGIAEVELTAEQVKVAAGAPLELDTSRTDIDGPTLWREDPKGVHVAVDDRALRMTSEPDGNRTKLTTRVYATQWGAPAARLPLSVRVVPVHGDTPGATVPPVFKGDTPSADGALKAGADRVGDDGWSTLTLQVVRDPGSRTPQLESQLYFVYPYAAPSAEKDPPPWGNDHGGPWQEAMLSVLVWSSYAVQTDPEWSEVQRLMTPYAKLYPSMTSLIDLTDRHSFETFANNPPWDKQFGAAPRCGFSAGAIPYLMTMPPHDPRFMPLSRDLSPNRTETVLNWIRNNQPKPPEGS